jgi:hypothetical protein
MYHDQLGLHTGAIAIGSPNATTCNPQIGAIHLLPTPLAAQSFLAARIAVTRDVSRRIPLTLWASGEEPRSLARMRDYVISFLAARIASSVTRFCILLLPGSACRGPSLEAFSEQATLPQHRMACFPFFGRLHFPMCRAEEGTESLAPAAWGRSP